MRPKLAHYIDSVLPGMDRLSGDRVEILEELANYCLRKIKSGESLKLLFICTHNSRRSHFSQIWAQVAAHYYGFKGLTTFSGGTAVTAFNERAVAALERAGMEIHKPDGANPRYEVSFSVEAEPVLAFSKVYDDLVNPRDQFAAVMTCSSADAECPVVLGAEKRIALLYIDPKVSDGTPEEEETYDERCRQIATELFFVWRRVRDMVNNPE